VIPHFLIDTLYSKLKGSLYEILGEKGCVKIFEENVEAYGSFEKTITYACRSTMAFINLRGDTVLIDLIGEGSEELFLEISKLLPLEYSFARRMLRGVGDAY